RHGAERIRGEDRRHANKALRETILRVKLPVASREDPEPNLIVANDRVAVIHQAARDLVACLAVHDVDAPWPGERDDGEHERRQARDRSKPRGPSPDAKLSRVACHLECYGTVSNCARVYRGYSSIGSWPGGFEEVTPRRRITSLSGRVRRISFA